MSNLCDRERWLAFAASLPETATDCPFENDFFSTVIRHRKNAKWFALLMRVPRCRVGLTGEEPIDILNLKTTPEDGMILRELYRGILPAYHMNKLHWLTLLSSSDVPQKEQERLIRRSYELTAPKPRKNPKES